MARSYTTLPLTDDHGLPLINVVVEGYDASDDSLVETAYTGAAGTAAFTALPADANYYFIARWGNKTLRWTRDFTLATKQFFTPCTAFKDAVPNAEWLPLGSTAVNWPAAQTRGVGDVATTGFFVPHDFNTLVGAYVILVAFANYTGATLTTYSKYAAIGENYTLHGSNNTTGTYDLVDDELSQLDCTALFPDLAANDFASIYFEQRTNSYNIDVFGVMIYYQ